jgi:hypothetical protein
MNRDGKASISNVNHLVELGKLSGIQEVSAQSRPMANRAYMMGEDPKSPPMHVAIAYRHSAALNSSQTSVRIASLQKEFGFVEMVLKSKPHHQPIDQTAEFTVLVSTVCIPIPDIYVAWLRGWSVEDALNQLYPKLGGYRHVSPAVLRKTIIGQYRIFEQMEPYLHRPAAFSGQFLFLLPMAVKQRLVHMYYELDALVAREILGKKLTSRSRKDLDDISNKTQVRVPSVRRQFENVKRVYKRVEESGGSLVANIESRFMLPPAIASRYAHTIFMIHHRFDTTKKKLITYSFHDFEYCSSVMLKYWTYLPSNSMEDFDPSFMNDVREFKNWFGNKDLIEDVRLLLMTDFIAHTQAGSVGGVTRSSSNDDVLGNSSGLPGTSNPMTPASDMPKRGPLSFITSLLETTPGGLSSSFNQQRDLGANMKLLLRNMVRIVSNLQHPKEARNLWIEWAEKIVEPCVSLGWRHLEVAVFFDVMGYQWDGIAKALVDRGLAMELVLPPLKASWTKLHNACKEMTLRLLPDPANN